MVISSHDKKRSGGLGIGGGTIGLTQAVPELECNSNIQLHHHEKKPALISCAAYTVTFKSFFNATMRVLPVLISCLTAVLAAGDSNLTRPLSSTIQLPSTFKPAQVFKNTNLVRTTSLEKGYVKENINVIIENVDPKKEAQVEYYVPFDAETISKIGGIEVRDRKDADAGPFVADVVEYDPYRYLKCNNNVVELH